MSKESQRIPISMYIDVAALTIFEGIGKSLVKTFELERSLRLAGLYIHPVRYACRILLYTVVSAFISATASVLLLLTTAPPLLIGAVYLSVMVLAPISTFAFGLSYPSLIASLRRLYVDSELPFFITYLATMVRGGVSTEVAISRVANLRVFRYISGEAGRIVRQIKVFGDDSITAITKVAHDSPSTKFRDFMLGYVATLRAGGDVIHYLETKAREALVNRISEIRSMVERLAIYLELYVILGVIVSLTVFTFFATSGAITAIGGPRLKGAGLDPRIPLLYNTLILPGLGFITLFLIHLSQPKTSFPHRLPYLMLLFSAPIAIPSALAVIIVGDSWSIFEGIVKMRNVPVMILSITIMLIVLSVPPWATYSFERRGTKGLIRALANFMRDLSETMKSGLSPEKCFITLSIRSYGNLTGIVRRIATAIAIGMSLDRALLGAVGRVKEWFLAVIFRFLVDSLSVGGGSPEVVDALANFTQGLSESEEELRRSLRLYMTLPYFGAVLVAVSPILIIWQLIAASPSPPEPDAIAPLTAMLSLGAIINSYVMGLIAGKIGSLTVAAGFKHSVIMTIMTAVAIIMTLVMFKML